jgi:regulator of sirC expression with transglutaminase-like and TPR domain
MNALIPATTQSTGLSETTKAALLKLLSDEDAEVYRQIRGTIIGHGPAVIEWLQPQILSNDPVLRRRARDIIGHFELANSDNRFLGFCVSHGEDLDLETGVWLLAKTTFPDVNVTAYEAMMDQFAAELRERLDMTSGAETILKAVNGYFFDQLGFSGNAKDYYHPDNSYLNRVIDRRTGNPISICAVYMLLAKRLRLPITGIGMPGHFICRHQSAVREFYIDVFNKGRLLTRNDCVKFLVSTGHENFEVFLSPMSPRRVLLRMCSNLHQIYTNLGRAREVERFQRYIVALSK